MIVFFIIGFLCGFATCFTIHHVKQRKKDHVEEIKEALLIYALNVVYGSVNVDFRNQIQTYEDAEDFLDTFVLNISMQ